MTNTITVETMVEAPLSLVWECWTGVEHIAGWAFASDDWEAKPVTNDVHVGGKFKTVMSAKDKSAAFDFTGVYTEVSKETLLAFDLDDGRKVKVTFRQTPQGVHVVETFDPENENSRELQRTGWQAFLDNFKKYVENRA